MIASDGGSSGPDLTTFERVLAQIDTVFDYTSETERDEDPWIECDEAISVQNVMLGD